MGRGPDLIGPESPLIPLSADYRRAYLDSLYGPLAEAIGERVGAVVTDAVAHLVAERYAEGVVEPVAGIAGYQDLVRGEPTAQEPQTTVTLDVGEAGAPPSAFNHTTGAGTNRYLLVEVAIASQTVTCTGVTYDGIALTRLLRQVHPTSNLSLELWGLAAPNVGTHPVLSTFSGGAGIAVGASSFFGVVQSPAPVAVGATGTGAAIASAPLTGAVGDLLVDAVAAFAAIAGPNGIQIWNDGGGEGQQRLAGNGAAQQLTWTTVTDWCSIAVVLRQVPSASAIDWRYPISGAAVVEPLSLITTLTTSAVAGLRTLTLEYRDADDVRYLVAGAPVQLDASQSQSFCWQPNAGDVAWPVDDVAIAPLPTQRLYGGASLVLHVGNAQNGDTLTETRFGAYYYPTGPRAA